MPRYSITESSLSSAKQSLESFAVPYLSLTQTECIVFSDDFDLGGVCDCLEYYFKDYECTPYTKIAFATNDAMEELLNKDVPTSRVIELCNLVITDSPLAAVNIYSFYNSVISAENQETPVALLYSNEQLNVKTTVLNSDSEK